MCGALFSASRIIFAVCRGRAMHAPTGFAPPLGCAKSNRARATCNRPYGCRERPMTRSANFIRLRRARNARPYGLRCLIRRSGGGIHRPPSVSHRFRRTNTVRPYKVIKKAGDNTECNGIISCFSFIFRKKPKDFICNSSRTAYKIPLLSGQRSSRYSHFRRVQTPTAVRKAVSVQSVERSRKHRSACARPCLRVK